MYDMDEEEFMLHIRPAFAVNYAVNAAALGVAKALDAASPCLDGSRKT